MQMTTAQAEALVRDAVRATGASAAVAQSLAQATVSAEWAGQAAVGMAHLPDYLDGFRQGRIARDPAPVISHPTPGTIRIDAQEGIAQLGFDLVFDDLVARARAQGVATLLQGRSYTVGELGYYTRRLAEAGLVALAACNATAQMTTAESGHAVYGTNPLSFAAPRAQGKPLVIDQASSATAFVKVREAARRSEALPEGWAVDAAGRPTTVAAEAVHGLLLPFGGARGAHIAMMVEILCAGLTGGQWSMDAPSYAAGTRSPGVGLFVLALQPEAPGFAERLSMQLQRLAEHGVRIPGSHIDIQVLDIPDALVAQLRGAAASAA